MKWLRQLFFRRRRYDHLDQEMGMAGRQLPDRKLSEGVGLSLWRSCLGSQAHLTEVAPLSQVGEGFG